MNEGIKVKNEANDLIAMHKIQKNKVPSSSK